MSEAYDCIYSARERGLYIARCTRDDWPSCHCNSNVTVINVHTWIPLCLFGIHDVYARSRRKTGGSYFIIEQLSGL